MTILHQNCCINTTDIVSNIFTGNTIPHSWYTQIITESGRPDHNAISIFSEIVYWYRPGREGRPKFKDDIWPTSYKHFEKRFGYNNQRIRRGLVRLEELGLIKREFRTIEKYGRTYTNVLFIRLISMPQDNSIFTKPLSKEENYDSICPQMNTGELVMSDYLDSCSSLDEKTNSYNEKKSFSLEERDDTTLESSKKMYLPLYKFDTPSLQICREYIDIENKRENKERRSDQRMHALSNFSFSSLDKESVCLNEISNSAYEKNKENLKTEDYPGIFSEISEKAKNLKSKPLDWEEGRVLSQLSDISEEEKDILNKRSGREFSLNFINQLVLKLGVKCPEHRFFRRKQFMNYMVKALMNEILQAPQANNEDFKFACLPKTEEEKYQKRVSKYLEDIEESIDVSSEMLLNKKILGRLEPKLAYEIISGTSLSIVESRTSDITEVSEQQKQEILRELHIKILRPLRLNSFVNESTTEIPDWIKQILLKEAKVIYGESVHGYSIETDIKFRNTFFKSSGEQIELSGLSYYPDADDYSDKEKNTNSVWNQVLDRLKETYGSATYKSWFSKLDILDEDAEFDTMEAKTKLKIQTQTGFVRDWVKTNYGSAIEKILKSFCPNLRYVEFV